jgi:hypothetical protein
MKDAIATLPMPLARDIDGATEARQVEQRQI